MNKPDYLFMITVATVWKSCKKNGPREMNYLLVNFDIEKLKKQENEFYSGPIADSKKCLDFLHKVKKAMS